MLTGILNINKPINFTSHDTINKLRKILKTKKIGHAGTLDPLAIGVLPVFIGKYTKLIQFLPGEKEYIAEITLGITTDSYDSEGEILSKQKGETNQTIITEKLLNYTGTIQQQVPLKSATHYKGKKLYKYAHKGIIIDDLPSKPVTIYNIELLDISYIEIDHPVIKVKIECSAGTYIRSIANDLGKDLNCGAYLSNLIRTKSSGLHLDDSITLDELSHIVDTNTLEQFLVDPRELINWPACIINNDLINKVFLGQFIKLENTFFEHNQRIFLINNNNQIQAVGRYDSINDLIKPEIVFA
ncbi:MAG: tRNA pseudouridine(55) synthase TruB [Cyanobacteriota bacterium]